MATALEGRNTEEERSVVRFLRAKALGAKDIHKEMFLVYGVKCLSRKAVHSSVEKLSRGRSKVADDARPGAGMAETTIKSFLCCGFRCTGKAMGQVYQCWWRTCREIHVFSTFKYHMFYVLYQFVTYLLTPSHIRPININVHHLISNYIETI
jgi:hypothetical protein